jgi:broad specificity phosphatase PhoE
VKLTIVRHGETVENKARITQGQSFGTLNETGLEQAKQTGIKLKGSKFYAVYCSDLDRCIKTAEQIKNHSGIKVDKYHKDLREKSVGEFEGR